MKDLFIITFILFQIRVTSVEHERCILEAHASIKVDGDWVCQA